MIPMITGGAGGDAGRGGAEVVLALDVGGSALKAGIVRADGTVVARSWLAWQPKGLEADVEAIVAVLRHLAARSEREHLGRPVGAGVAVAGIVDEATGLVVLAANLNWRDVPLGDRLSGGLHLPVALGQDARCAGRAEAALGVAAGEAEALFVAAGTGIGACRLAGGEVRAGAHGRAGELGHVVVEPGGAPCGCGGSGCLETVASAAAIARRYGERTGRAVTGAEEVVARMAEGDREAGAVLDEAMEALATALRSWQAALDTSLVVLGGGLFRGGPELVERLRSATDGRWGVCLPPRLERSSLGVEAGMLGAGLLAHATARR